MFDDINDLYQQVILDHCKNPRNFRETPQCSCSAQGHNPLCGDQLKLFLTLDGEAMRWTGVILYAIGGAFRIAPVFTLGERFSGWKNNSKKNLKKCKLINFQIIIRSSKQ